MEISNDLSQVETTARELLDNRLQAAMQLARQGTELQEAQKKIAAMEREYAALYGQAKRAGWTSDELKRLGQLAPEHPPRGRPRGAGARLRRTESTTPVAAQSSKSGSNDTDPSGRFDHGDVDPGKAVGPRWE